MSWFEDPNNAAAAAFQATLTGVAANLDQNLAARDDDYSRMASNALGLNGAALAGSNASALKVLRGGFKKPAPVDYYQAGDQPTLPDSLVKAGVTATILGPPIDPNLVAQMNGKGQQYLASNADGGQEPTRFNRAFDATAAAYPSDAFELFSTAEIAQRISGNCPDLAEAKAAQVDNTINNQSLVILFTVAGKTLLFAGDAQWGNWQNFLFGGAIGTADHKGLTPEAKQVLGSLDFYKVGHHGSTNATPIDAVEAMRKDCVAMCSTQPGAYGKLENNSEVPRGPLMDALNLTTVKQLARSDQVHVPGADDPSVLEKIRGLPVPGPLPPVFQGGPGGQLYVDYVL
jgi:hypothetical protein